MLACMGPLPDPLAGQRAALASLAPPTQGWAPQAVLALSPTTLEQGVTDAVNGVLGRGLAPLNATAMGVTASLEPTAEVAEVQLMASDACESCLELRVELRGAATAALSNSTGAKRLSMGFTGGLRGVMALSFDGEQLLAQPAALDRWSATMAWEALPAGFSQAVSGLFTDALRRQLNLTSLPPIPVVRLRGETPVPVTALRVRPEGEQIVVDFAFAVPSAGVAAAPREPVQGWLLVVPVETALGLMQAVALAQPYNPNERATPEFTGLRAEGSGFELDLRAWPTRARARPRDVTVTGMFGLDASGDLAAVAQGARWVRERGDPPDLTALLLGDRLLDGLVAALSGSMPGQRAQGFGGLELVATTTSASASEGALRISGQLALAGSGRSVP